MDLCVVLPSKKDQSLIIFSKVRYQIPTSNDSDEDLVPSQIFHYARSAHRMIKEMGYGLRHGEGLNFRKGWCISLQSFIPKGKLANYYDLIVGWGILPHPSNLIRNLKNSTITLLRLIRLEIWHKCVGCLQETRRQHDINKSSGMRRGHWAIQH